MFLIINRPDVQAILNISIITTVTLSGQSILFNGSIETNVDYGTVEAAVTAFDNIARTLNSEGFVKLESVLFRPYHVNKVERLADQEDLLTGTKLTFFDASEVLLEKDTQEESTVLYEVIVLVLKAATADPE